MNCTKVQYTSERFAIEDIRRINRKTKGAYKLQKAYLCPHCNFWHLTSLKDKRDESIIALKNRISALEKDNRVLQSRIKDLMQREEKLIQDNEKLRIKNATLGATNQKLSELEHKLKAQLRTTQTYSSTLREQQQEQREVSGGHTASRRD